MVVSNCARRLAGRIFMSRAIRTVSIRAVRHDQRASLMRHHQIVLRYSTSVNMLNLTAENYETMPTFLAKTKPSKRPLAGLSRNSRSVRGSARRRESRVCRGTAQQVKRQIERLVILGVRRNVGLRTGFLLAFGAQVPTQRGLAPGGYPRLELLGHILQHLDVGHDSLCLDGTSRRRVVARRGQPQRAIAGTERNDGLYRPLAEGTRADDGGALVVLQGAGDDLRSRGRAAVDQDDDRFALGKVAGPHVESLRLLGVAATGRDDLALLQKCVGHRDRLIQQAARIVAKVEDIALELVAS